MLLLESVGLLQKLVQSHIVFKQFREHLYALLIALFRILIIDHFCSEYG